MLVIGGARFGSARSASAVARSLARLPVECISCSLPLGPIRVGSIPLGLEPGFGRFGFGRRAQPIAPGPLPPRGPRIWVVRFLAVAVTIVARVVFLVCVRLIGRATSRNTHCRRMRVVSFVRLVGVFVIVARSVAAQLFALRVVELSFVALVVIIRVVSRAIRFVVGARMPASIVGLAQRFVIPRRRPVIGAI